MFYDLLLFLLFSEHFPNNSEQFRTLLNSEHVGLLHTEANSEQFRTIPNTKKNKKNTEWPQNPKM